MSQQMVEISKKLPVLNTLKEKKLEVGAIVEKVNAGGFIKLNFVEDNSGEDFIVTAIL